jgi:hypothetical protein
VRSTTAPYTESRLTRSVANERVGFPVVEQVLYPHFSVLQILFMNKTRVFVFRGIFVRIFKTRKEYGIL